MIQIVWFPRVGGQYVVGEARNDNETYSKMAEAAQAGATGDVVRAIHDVYAAHGSCVSELRCPDAGYEYKVKEIQRRGDMPVIGWFLTRHSAVHFARCCLYFREGGTRVRKLRIVKRGGAIIRELTARDAIDPSKSRATRGFDTEK